MHLLEHKQLWTIFLDFNFTTGHAERRIPTPPHPAARLGSELKRERFRSRFQVQKGSDLQPPGKARPSGERTCPFFLAQGGRASDLTQKARSHLHGKGRKILPNPTKVSLPQMEATSVSAHLADPPRESLGPYLDGARAETSQDRATSKLGSQSLASA